jgi:hypothetical protein
VLLEGHRYKSSEALKDGIVDAIAPPDKMFDLALEVAQKWKSKAKMGVYGVLRNELVGEATRACESNIVNDQNIHLLTVDAPCRSDEQLCTSSTNVEGAQGQIMRSISSYRLKSPQDWPLKSKSTSILSGCPSLYIWMSLRWEKLLHQYLLHDLSAHRFPDVFHNSQQRGHLVSCQARA